MGMSTRNALTSGCAVVEGLETRRLLAGITIPLEQYADAIYDTTSELLYIPTHDGTIERFDPQSRSLLSPLVLNGWEEDNWLGGGDITPDGRWLYVADGKAKIIWQVDLATGVSTARDVSSIPGSGGAGNIVIGSENTALVLVGNTVDVSGGYDYIANVVLYQVNPVSGALENPTVLGGGRVLERSADRTTAAVEGAYGTLSLISLDTGTTISSRSTSNWWFPMQVNRDGSLVATVEALSEGGGGVFDRSLNTIGIASGTFNCISVFDPQRDLLHGMDSAGLNLLTLDTNTWQQVGTRRVADAERPIYFGNSTMGITGDGRYVLMQYGWESHSDGRMFTAKVVMIPLSMDADPGLPYLVVEGDQITLQGSGNPEPGYTITAYEWDLNYDGLEFDVDATGQSPVFGAPYGAGNTTRMIGLRVVADDGQTSPVATQTVTIHPWTATIDGPDALDTGEAAAWIGATNANAASIARYEWDLDYDGTFGVDSTQSTVDLVGPTVVADTIRTIALRAVSTNGATSPVATRTVTIHPWIVTIGAPESLPSGGTGWLSATTESTRVTIERYEWDFDYDGSFTVDSTDPYLAFAAPFVTTQRTITIALRAVSTGGQASAVATRSVTIQPDLDSFANALLIGSGTNEGVTIAGSNIGATMEDGEPFPYSSSGASIWYRWVAPLSGMVVIDTVGSGFDTVLGIYTGTSVSSLASLPNGTDDDGGGMATSRVSVYVEAGREYYIDIAGYGGRTGKTVLNIGVVSEVTTHAPTNLELSSTEIGADDSAGAMVGYFTTSDDDPDDFSFTYSLVDGDGSADNASFYIDGDELRMSEDLDADKASYSIRVRTTDPAGLYLERVFTIDRAMRSNDNLADAYSISAGLGGVTAVTGTNLDASKEPGEPNHAGYEGGSSVWYRWMAPRSGLVTIDTIGSSFRTLLAVYSYYGTPTLTAVPGGSDANGAGDGACRATFRVVKDSAYFIAVDGYDGDTGDFALNISPVVTNRAPTGIVLSNTTVAAERPAGTLVGYLHTADPNGFDRFSYWLVDGAGSSDNGRFFIWQNQLRTSEMLDDQARTQYSIRVRTVDAGGLHLDRVFKVSMLPVSGSFGARHSWSFSDDDGDRVTLRLRGGGEGNIDERRQIVLTGTLPSTMLAISVRKSSGGDGMVQINGIWSDGLLKAISARTATISGTVEINATSAAVGRHSVTLDLGAIIDGSIATNGLPIASLKLLDWHDADIDRGELNAPSIGQIRISGRKENHRTAAVEYLAGDLDGHITVAGSIGSIMAAGSIAGTIRSGMNARGSGIGSIIANGGLYGATIVSSGSIGTIAAPTLADSEVLVGVATEFAANFAERGDFVNTAAQLTRITVAGQRLPGGSMHPVYVTNARISAPSIGWPDLANVSSAAGAIQANVLDDTGTLTISELGPLVAEESVLVRGRWMPGAADRPAVFVVV